MIFMASRSSAWIREGFTLQQHGSVYSRSTVKLVLCTFERDGNLGCDRGAVMEQAK